MKIGVIGAGSVGVGVCNYLLTLGSVRELVLFNRTLSRAEGEVLDFSHTNALTFSKNTKLIATNKYKDLADADIVAITAGAQVKIGQSRLDLAEINSKLGVEIAKEIEKVAPNAILIIVSNPCDVISYFIAANTSFNPRKIISSGCVVDTARLMSIVASRVKVDPKNVFGYIIGEHGSNCFTPKSLISIAGQPIDYYCSQNNISRIDCCELLETVKQSGLDILERKQNTTHGVSASVFRIIQAISINEHSVLPVGTLLNGEYGLHNVVLSLPCVINSDGIGTLLTHPFTNEEIKMLHDISDRLKLVIRNVSEKTKLKMYHFENSTNNTFDVSLWFDKNNRHARESHGMMNDHVSITSGKISRPADAFTRNTTTSIRPKKQKRSMHFLKKVSQKKYGVKGLSFIGCSALVAAYYSVASK